MPSQGSEMGLYVIGTRFRNGGGGGCVGGDDDDGGDGMGEGIIVGRRCGRGRGSAKTILSLYQTT